MSLISGRFRFLTSRPKIRATPDTLTISTGWQSRLLTLGLRTRRVEIDTSNRRLTFATRTAYFFARHWRLGFDELSHLDYGMGSLGTDYGWTDRGFGAQDSVESYTIDLVTTAGQRHRVCAYRGEGAVQTGWTGVLLGDDSVFDAAGTQQSESKQLVEMLSNVLALPIGQPLDSAAAMPTCPACGQRTAARRTTCLYCGAPLNT